VTRRWRLAIRLASVGLGLLAVALLAGRLLLTPAQGDVLVLLSARVPDRIGASQVELHSSSGWTSRGRVEAHSVPRAPETATAVQASAPTGDYDALRIGGRVLPARFTVQRSMLATILVPVAGGQPVPGGVYAGSEAVSLASTNWPGSCGPCRRSR
jgi:hypothetical protein